MISALLFIGRDQARIQYLKFGMAHMDWEKKGGGGGINIVEMRIL